MKKKLFTLLLAVAASVGTIIADGTKIGDLYYNLDADNLTAEVTYQAEQSSSNYSGLTSANIPSSVTYNSQTYSVTSIGDKAFYYCSSLTSVTIPNSVTSIGFCAFQNCSGLTKVNITDIAAWCNIAFGGSTAANPLYYAKHLFVNDVEVTELVIPNGVTSIGQYAFYYCSGLTSVTIPNSVTSIGHYAFQNCSSLTSMTIPNSVTSIGNRAFENCSSLTSLKIGNGVTSIGNNAFRDCSGLTSVTIGNSVTSIDVGAFNNCSGLTKVNITDIAAWCNIAFVNGPSNPLYNAKHLFVNDVEVTELTIPNSVTSIGNRAFEGCSSLTSVTIPNSVTSIGQYAFRDCSGLTSVTIPNSVTSIDVGAFRDCSGLTSVTIPNSVTSIGHYAFQNCSGLTSVTIPNSVTSIGNIAFRYVNNIIYSGEATGSPWGAKCVNGYVDGYLVYSDATKTILLGCSAAATGEIVIPNSVTSIGQYAFQNCSSLTSMTIPNSVTSIGNRAFENCSSLTDIYVCGDLERFLQLLNNDDRIKVGMPYSITINAEHGNVSYPQTMCDDMSLTATPEYGYHFVKWSDGNIANPRAIELTRDTTFTALFAPNQYTLSLQCDGSQGVVEGAGVFDYLAQVQISATPAYGYHFTSWSDGNTANPRTITIAKDVTLTVNFAPNTYSLNVSCNAEQGSVTGSGSYSYLSNRTIEAIPNYGYHFAQWNDGNTDNPRTFVLTKDTTFTALFVLNQYTLSLQCDDNQGTVEGAGVFDYLTEVQISATPAYGYHFSSWSDGNTDNPRTISVTEDKSYTATFAKNTYTITKIANNEQGSVSGPTQGEYLDNITLIVTPEYGYHFAQWNDGNTDNPRTFELTRDTTFTAQFAPNQYTLSLQCDENQGSVEGAGVFDYLAEVQISATPAYGYHFSSWSDGDTANPRTISVTEDKSYTATFAKNTYTITKIANNEQGSVSGPAHGEYLDNITLTVTPEYGYHFTQWFDGNTDNPRTFELTCDTTFTALFALNQYTLSLLCDGNQGTVEGAGVFDYLAEVQISATPAYGYHFSSWSDGDTANPRTISVTEDKSYTATFAKNTYTITKIANNEQGSVSGPTQGEYLDNISLTATPEYGYHFTQWSDGNTDNPRTFELTRDTTFTALFALNQYTLSLQCDGSQGVVEGAGLFDYLAEVQISATPAYGYHFSSWSDGDTANPRTYTVTKDVTITANFAPNKYSINVSCNAEQGSVTGSGSYNYLSNRTIEATSNYGYHFKQWSDGNTDNPRTIELRQDTTFEAIFAVDKYGTCGDNLQLTWRYDTGSQTLTISGEGDLTTNMRYGVEAVKEMKELVIEDGVGVIGNEAFANIKTLNTITLGKDVRKLQERVFYNCYNLTAIYNYRKTPASATSNTFEEVDKYACTIYVLAGSEEMFRNATGWKDFYSILTIGASETTVTDNNATVVPSANTATVTWPVSNEAASYTIEITKDGVVFCRLTFNANGQLTGIAFAPGRDGQSMAPAALMTANGLQFTVTGLSSNTQYGYNVTANDANEQPIATYSGSFTTTSEGVPTGIDNTPFLSGEGRGEASKILRNGQLLIINNGKTFTVQGQQLQ